MTWGTHLNHLSDGVVYRRGCKVCDLEQCGGRLALRRFYLAAQSGTRKDIRFDEYEA